MSSSIERNTSSTDPLTWFVAYDVQADGRRQRLANLLSSYGERVQRSVFVVWVSARQLPELRERAEEIIAADTDSVILVPVPKIAADNVVELGQAFVPEQQLCWIV